MENFEAYFIILCGIFGSLFVVARRSIFRRIARRIYRSLAYTFILRRHRWMGPWTVGAFMLQISYIIANFICIAFRVSSLADAGARAGRLSLINMAPLFLGPHLGFLADVFGMPVRAFHKVHCSYGAMSTGLVLFHGGVMALLEGPQDIYVSTGAISLAVLLLLSMPLLRRAFYEIFLRTHQAIAIFAASSIWWHLRSMPRFPWEYIYIYGGLSGILNLFQLGCTAYRNKRWGSPLPRLIIREDGGDVCITVELSRPVRLKAGQYINLWIWAPTVSFWSWTQSHPFTVVSWSPAEQRSLELLIQPRKGFTSKLLQTNKRMKNGDDASLSYPALFSGPHGISFPVWGFKTVLMFATGFGIAAMLPYLEKLIHDHKYCKSRTRRIHLVWHTEGIPQFTRILNLLNYRLKDDAIDNSYILHISIYNEGNEGRLGKKEFGEHGRAAFFAGLPDLEAILAAENGNFIQPMGKGGACMDHGDLFRQVEEVQTDKGRVLVLASGTAELRDKLRELVRRCSHKKVSLKELDYQPG
ncbi:putative cell surface metalloreductase [Chaetomium strumarium]|uniref:ferric-chelate reductase (NADPH) n=1 Tax=Chaetomium strumarium TaxID=1170767 RepID=A0AAJ0M0V0_9PEZI|nr:putative cell surface metalloreductase [Chaetomium strumarium]